MKFAILTPTFERNERLKRAVKSVLTQTWEDWELIIVDDGSVKVDTKKVLEEFLGDERIRFFQGKENKGAGVARNLAMDKMSLESEWVVQLDSDDELVPEALEKMKEEIEANPGKKFWWWGTKDEHGKKIGWVKGGKLEVNYDDFFEKIDVDFGEELMPVWHRSLNEIVKFDEKIFFACGISWMKILKSGENLQMRDEALRIYWQGDEGICRQKSLKSLSEKYYQSMKRGEEEMLRLFGEVISKNKKIHARGLAVLGRALIKLGMRKEGLKRTWEALKVNPLEIRVWWNLMLWGFESLGMRWLP